MLFLKLDNGQGRNFPKRPRSQRLVSSVFRKINSEMGKNISKRTDTAHCWKLSEDIQTCFPLDLDWAEGADSDRGPGQGAQLILHPLPPVPLPLGSLYLTHLQYKKKYIEKAWLAAILCWYVSKQGCTWSGTRRESFKNNNRKMQGNYNYQSKIGPVLLLSNLFLFV